MNDAMNGAGNAGPSNLPTLHGLDFPFMQVREFHDRFGHPVANVPTPLTRERRETRAKWKNEEAQEFIDAEELVDQVDACLDNIYFNLGSLVEMGVLPQALMDIVHYDGNMSKMHLIDGEKKVVKNEDGKVIKPEGWVSPEPRMQQEIDRQSVQQPLAEVAA